MPISTSANPTATPPTRKPFLPNFTSLSFSPNTDNTQARRIDSLQLLPFIHGMHRYPLLAILAFVSLTFLRGTTQAIIIDEYTTDTNDRFANSLSFIAADFDLSGIAINNNGRWLTMISPNVFLSAYHHAPANGSSVTFYAGNDPLGDSLTRTVSTNTRRIGTSDIWIGTLNEPLTASYTYYNFATEPITSHSDLTTSPDYYLSEAYLFGLTPGGAYPTSQNMAIGKNVIDDFADSISALVTVVDEDSPETNFTEFEAALADGDSGAGMFIEQSGSLTLVGINWVIFTDGIGGPTIANGFSYLGNYATEINAFLTTHSVPVPEPTTTVLIIGLAATLIARRHRAA